MTEPALKVAHLSASYGDELVLEDVSFELGRGDLVGLIGPNGAGKSTLLEVIMGGHKQHRGRVEICGERGRRARRRITYVPQRERIDWDFPVTVRGVVRQGRYGQVGLLGRFRAEDHRVVDGALERMGMSAWANRQIGELSGGQRQRVFLARALAQRGDIYLLDEPFVGIDATTEEVIVSLIRELRASGRAVVVVHHDLSTAQHYFDRLLLLNKRVIAFGEVAEVFTVENLQRTYGGQMTVLNETQTLLRG